VALKAEERGEASFSRVSAAAIFQLRCHRRFEIARPALCRGVVILDVSTVQNYSKRHFKSAKFFGRVCIWTFANQTEVHFWHALKLGGLPKFQNAV
jgi:hypothetical protein